MGTWIVIAGAHVRRWTAYPPIGAVIRDAPPAPVVLPSAAASLERFVVLRAGAMVVPFDARSGVPAEAIDHPITCVSSVFKAFADDARIVIARARIDPSLAAPRLCRNDRVDTRIAAR